MPSATIIDALPTFISPEEHRAAVQSTPSSFSDIPPVLRHEEKDISVSFDPALEGLSHQTGNLYIAESALFFFAPNGNGFKVDYPAITLHAISRADSNKPSIYCQLDEHAGEENAPAAEDEDMDMRELFLVPQNADALEPIFEALSLCASLHPDQMDEDEEDNAFIDSGNFETFDGDANEELSEVGRAALEHLESIIVYPNTNGTEKDEEK